MYINKKEIKMPFDVDSFLEENSNKLEVGFSGDVAPMKIEVGFLVPGGKNTKFFPVSSDKMTQVMKKQADAYAQKLKEETGKNYFSTGAIQQTWTMTEAIGKAWSNDGFPVHAFSRGDDKEWELISSQWKGEDAPLSPDDFGKEFYVHFKYYPHPEFDPDNPTRQTAQWDNSLNDWRRDDEGNIRPQLLKIAVEKVGETREQAQKWFGANKDGSDPVAVSNLEDAIRGAIPELWENSDEADNDAWAEVGRSLFDSFHDGKAVDELWQEWEPLGWMDKADLEKVKELTKTFPPL